MNESVTTSVNGRIELKMRKRLILKWSFRKSRTLVTIEDCSRPLILLIVQGMSYHSSLAGRRNRIFLIRVCPIWRSIGAPYLVTFPYLVIFQYSVIPDMIAGIHGSKVSQIKHLSSPRTKSLRAESARAVTGRRCPHSRKGEEFLTLQPDFFTETAVTPDRKVEKSFPRWEINRHVEG